MLGVNLTNNSLELWKIEVKEAIKTTDELSKLLKTKVPKTNYPIFITQRLARKVFRDGPKGPLWKQFVPMHEENKNFGMEDPIGDHEHSKGARIIHRYQNRLLFMPTTICPINCRYCFRKNELANPDHIFKGQLSEATNYLKNNPEVNEVILSGGDPLMMDDGKLETIFKAFSQIRSVKYLRLHTRTPIIIPSRITKDFLELLEKYSNSFNKIIMAIHTNHLDEIDDDVEWAIKKLRRTKTELLSQTVLLKNVNDDLRTLVRLFEGLSDLGVRPYYLHHPDRARGAMHFHLSLTEGRMLYHGLRNILPGWMIPEYVIDIPGGEGKISAFNPESFDFSGRLINKSGETIKISPLRNIN